MKLPGQEEKWLPFHYQVRGIALLFQVRDWFIGSSGCSRVIAAGQNIQQAGEEEETGYTHVYKVIPV
jgi:hypothetical protein